MESLAIVGLVTGMRHALEADHVAAVASLVAVGASGRGAVRLGAAWGLGHATTILVVGSIALLGEAKLPQTWSPIFESLVGLMLLALGIDVLRRRAVRQPGSVLMRQHHMPHGRGFVVGAVHGLAGSAALMLLIAGATDSPFSGLLGLALFGVGSVAGMMLLAMMLSLSLRFATVRAQLVGGGLVVLVGLSTAALGLYLVLQSSSQISWSAISPSQLGSVFLVSG